MNIKKISFLCLGMSLGTSAIQADEFIPCPTPEEIHWKQRKPKIHPYFWQPFSSTFKDGEEIYSKEEPSISDLIKREIESFEESALLTCIYKIKDSQYKATIHYFVPNPLKKWIRCSQKIEKGKEGFSCKVHKVSR